MHPGSARGSSARGEVLASISTGLVRLHSRYYGKGPTKAKTYLVSDTVVCMLRGGFTTVERTLIDEGNVDAVYQIRRSFQQAMEEHFTTVVEADGPQGDRLHEPDPPRSRHRGRNLRSRAQ